MSQTTRSVPETGTLVRVGLLAGVLAGMMMALWQMVVGALADEPTAVFGIDSSFWTAVTSITSFFFGVDAFHETFEPAPVLFGIGVHMVNSMMLGVAGVALIVALLGARPNPLAAVMQAIGLALVVQVVLLNLIVNQIQDINSVYTSTPEWSWWVSHGIYGMTLGATAALLLRRVAR